MTNQLFCLLGFHIGFPMCYSRLCSQHTLYYSIQEYIPVNQKIKQDMCDWEGIQITSLLNNGHIKSSERNFIFFQREMLLVLCIMEEGKNSLKVCTRPAEKMIYRNTSSTVRKWISYIRNIYKAVMFMLQWKKSYKTSWKIASQ